MGAGEIAAALFSGLKRNLFHVFSFPWSIGEIAAAIFSGLNSGGTTDKIHPSAVG
jgi:hypothetical protein